MRSIHVKVLLGLLLCTLISEQEFYLDLTTHEDQVIGVKYCPSLDLTFHQNLLTTASISSHISFGNWRTNMEYVGID